MDYRLYHKLTCLTVSFFSNPLAILIFTPQTPNLAIGPLLTKSLTLNGGVLNHKFAINFDRLAHTHCYKTLIKNLFL